MSMSHSITTRCPHMTSGFARLAKAATKSASLTLPACAVASSPKRRRRNSLTSTSVTVPPWSRSAIQLHRARSAAGLDRACRSPSRRLPLELNEFLQLAFCVMFRSVPRRILSVSSESNLHERVARIPWQPRLAGHEVCPVSDRVGCIVWTRQL